MRWRGARPSCSIRLSSACRLLQVSAITDDAKFECELSPIAFRPTVMFQNRAFTFPLKNTSMARLNHKWAVLMPDGQPDPTSLYQASPRHEHAAGCQCNPASLMHCQPLSLTQQSAGCFYERGVSSKHTADALSQLLACIHTP